MPTFHFQKLIRSKIKSQFEAAGIQVHERPLNQNEELPVLLNKLAEEVDEALSATNPESLLEELADIQEVVEQLLACEAIDASRLREKRTEKATSRGGFSPLCFCVSIEVPDFLLEQDAAVRSIVKRLRADPSRYPESPSLYEARFPKTSPKGQGVADAKGEILKSKRKQ